MKKIGIGVAMAYLGFAGVANADRDDFLVKQTGSPNGAANHVLDITLPCQSFAVEQDDLAHIAQAKYPFAETLKRASNDQHAQDNGVGCHDHKGWEQARVTWSNNQGTLFVDNTIVWVGDHATAGFMHLMLDGSGDPATFDRVYRGQLDDPTSSILNDPNLQLLIEAKKTDGDNDASWDELVMKNNYHPQARAIWADHSADTIILDQRLDQERRERIAGDAATLAAANAYTDATEAALHAHIHTEEAAEAAARAAADAFLQSEIDLRVVSVTATYPIESSGGVNPNIDLAPCPDGQGYIMQGGAWTCQAGGNHFLHVYYKNQPSCGGEQHDVTIDSGCSFFAGCAIYQLPGCPGGCNIQITSVSTVCSNTCFTCGFFNCHSFCCGFGTQYCGNCICNFGDAGYTVQ